jgi:ABC-type enterochelin transport system substrate-binding protein
MTTREKLYNIYEGTCAIAHAISKGVLTEEGAKNAVRLAYIAALELPLTNNGKDFNAEVKDLMEKLEEKGKSVLALARLQNVLYHVLRIEC